MVPAVTKPVDSLQMQPAQSSRSWPIRVPLNSSKSSRIGDGRQPVSPPPPRWMAGGEHGGRDSRRGGRRVCHGARATSAPVDHASRASWGRTGRPPVRVCRPRVQLGLGHRTGWVRLWTGRSVHGAVQASSRYSETWMFSQLPRCAIDSARADRRLPASISRRGHLVAPAGHVAQLVSLRSKDLDGERIVAVLGLPPKRKALPGA